MEPRPGKNSFSINIRRRRVVAERFTAMSGRARVSVAYTSLKYDVINPRCERLCLGAADEPAFCAVPRAGLRGSDVLRLSDKACLGGIYSEGDSFAQLSHPG